MLAGAANGEGGAGKTKMQALGVAGERGRVKGCIRARRGLPGQSRGDARPFSMSTRCASPKTGRPLNQPVQFVSVRDYGLTACFQDDLTTKP